MGDKPWDWFLPIQATPGDGVRFEYNEELLTKMHARAREVLRAHSAQSTSNRGGSDIFSARAIDEKEGSTLGSSGKHI
jgi:hypothetical protein